MLVGKYLKKGHLMAGKKKMIANGFAGIPADTLDNFFI